MIVIDHTKCTTPETCGRCLKVCSPQVFALYPEEEDVKEPHHWRVDPVWISFCTQCNQCVKECPHNAISLK